MPGSRKVIRGRPEALRFIIHDRRNAAEYVYSSTLQLLVSAGWVEQINSSLYRPTAKGLEEDRLHPLPPQKVDMLEAVSDRNFVISVWEDGIYNATKRVRGHLRRLGYTEVRYGKFGWTPKALAIFEEERTATGEANRVKKV